MPFEKQIKEHARRRKKAQAMGGPERLKRRAAQGVLNARERLEKLLDRGSFTEAGLFATSSRVEDADRTPADGKVTGYGRIDGRPVAVASNDLTVRGASSARVNQQKIAHVKRVATRNGMPMIFLGESTGARMPDAMGARGMGTGAQDPTQYIRMREIPWASAVLGPCFGSSTWFACLSDFVVMRKGALLAVSSGKVTSAAIGEDVDPEELGGWRLQTEVTGMADLAVDTDEEALEAVKKFLSYLPSHHNQPPPEVPVTPKAAPDAEALLKILPESRNRVYDVRKVIQAIVDKESFFPLKENFGKTAVTGLARLGGKSVGILASNPLVKAGALDPDACDKITHFLVICDSFNIPVILLVDTPGFLVGVEGERKRAPGKIMNFMHALQLCTVPRLSVVMRKTYGQAYLNMGGGRNSDEVAAWFTAEVSFMDPAIGVGVVHGVHPDSDPERFEALRDEMVADTSAYEFAAIFGAQQVIDPRETREHLIRMLDIHSRALTAGIGQHIMRSWPATY